VIDNKTRLSTQTLNHSLNTRKRMLGKFLVDKIGAF